MCTLVESVECVHWWRVWSVYTGGVCGVYTLVESVECVHWWSVWSVYTGGVCGVYTLVESVECVHCWSVCVEIDGEMSNFTLTFLM